LQLDAEIKRLDDPSEADIAAIRKKRLEDMKKRQVWLRRLSGWLLSTSRLALKLTQDLCLSPPRLRARSGSRVGMENTLKFSRKLNFSRL